MKYDAVVSLGYNCEISFRLENFFGKINAMPFSWSYVLERESFPAVLEHIDPLFSGEVRLLEDRMILCENTKIKFHPRYEILQKDGTITEDSLAEAVQELKSRVEHLKKKYVELVASDKRTLFLIKVENKGEEDNIRFVRDVTEALRKAYRSGLFTLVVLAEKEAVTPGLQSLEGEQLKIRALKRFAPRKHTDIAGDVKGWYRVLQEMTGESGKGYRRRLWKKRREWFFAVLKKKLLKR